MVDLSVASSTRFLRGSGDETTRPMFGDASEGRMDYTVHAVGSTEVFDIDGELAVIYFHGAGATMTYLDIEGIDVGIRSSDMANSTSYRLSPSELERRVKLTTQIVGWGYRHLRRAQRHAVTASVGGRWTHLHVVNAPEVTAEVLGAARLIDDGTRIIRPRRIESWRKKAAVIGRVGDIISGQCETRDVELRFGHRWDSAGRSQVYVTVDRATEIGVRQFWHRGSLYGVVGWWFAVELALLERRLKTAAARGAESMHLARSRHTCWI